MLLDIPLYLVNLHSLFVQLGLVFSPFANRRRHYLSVHFENTCLNCKGVCRSFSSHSEFLCLYWQSFHYLILIGLLSLVGPDCFLGRLELFIRLIRTVYKYTKCSFLTGLITSLTDLLQANYQGWIGTSKTKSTGSPFPPWSDRFAHSPVVRSPKFFSGLFAGYLMSSLRGRSAGSFCEQQLRIKPRFQTVKVGEL